MKNKYFVDMLPTLLDVVRSLKKEERYWVANGGWKADDFAIESMPVDLKWNVPFMDFYNNASDDQFIVVQTQHRRHTLKPNLVHKPFLYRGQNKDYKHIVSSFGRDELPDKKRGYDSEYIRSKHLVSNLKTEEFIATLRTHPLFMLLDRGISLEPDNRPLFLNMNYYGLAQHYGFKTAVVDFTTDIDVAAFFACTENVGNDKYKPITDLKQHKSGVLYVHEIKPMFTFKGAGFSTIGLQIYPRSGAQKGVLFNETKCALHIDRQVRAIPFRHDAMASRHFWEIMEKGEKLFPKDGISSFANELLERSEVSGSVFANNLYTNQEEFVDNIAALNEFGISVNWHSRPHFSGEMLHQVFQDIKNDLWEGFCNQIYFADKKKGKQIHEALLNLPKNPTYSSFFDENKFKNVTYYEDSDHCRAENNRKY